MDPLEGEYTPQSPYCYCSNNPTIKIDPDGKGDKATTRVTPEVAGQILENTVSGKPAFDPSKGKGGASWFVSRGNPYTGVSSNKNVSIDVNIDTRGAIKISSGDLVAMRDKILNDPAFRSKIETQVRGNFKIAGDSPLTGKVLKQFNNNLMRSAEAEMWNQVAEKVKISSSGVGEVILENSEFSKTGNGRFLVVTNQSKISVTADAIMKGMDKAGLSVSNTTREALQTTLKEAKVSGKYNIGAADVRNAFRIGGRILTIVGASADAYKIYHATDKWKTGAEVAGGWSGGIAAASTFSAWFAPADTAGPLAWALHGVGSLAAFALGYNLGSKAASKLYEVTFSDLNSTQHSSFGGFGGGGAGGSW